VNYHASSEPVRAVRTQRYKYIRRYGDRVKPVLPNCDDSLSKSLSLESGWRDRELAREELYDLVFDPNEQNNLCADRNSACTLRDMRTRLDRWMISTHDPLLMGRVLAPPAPRSIPPTAYRPRSPSLTPADYQSYFFGLYVIHIGDAQTISPSSCSPRT
jgi:hypothetical protein